MSRQQRLYALNNVAIPPPSPGLTSPVNVTGFNFMSDQNRIGSSQGLPPNRAATSTGPSLFIPKRRPSQLAQPFHRPPNTSRGNQKFSHYYFKTANVLFFWLFNCLSFTHQDLYLKDQNHRLNQKLLKEKNM
jgi:hypothetical protein